MKFGKLAHLDGLPLDAFELPEDAQVTQRILRHEARPLNVRCGGTMWTIRGWRGKVYPQGMPQRLWPEAYGQSFGTLEFNATHYRIYEPERMADWANGMPDSFRFCPKFPQLITHFRRFANCEGPTADFLDGLLALGQRLGPTFVQLPPHFGPKKADALINYLEQWPRELKLAVEFRHPDWFTADPEAERTWLALEELGMGAVISDTLGRRDAVHMRVTAPFVLIRWGGYDGHPSDKKRLNDWAKRLKSWFDSGLEEAHFLVHQPDSLSTPETCALFSELMEECSGHRPLAPAILPFG
jgi:uncharacterized protein YecE (DUF72 family)